MARKIYKIISWALLIATVVSFVLALRKPKMQPVEVSAAAANSFDEKLAQLDKPAPAGAPPQEIHISESELNSKLQQSLEAPTGDQAVQMKAAEVHLVDDQAIATFTVSVEGKNVYVTLGGKIGDVNGQLQFDPTQVKMGSMPLPASLMSGALREKLNSPALRDQMRLPENIKDVRIENGELLLVCK
jgi:hypothetical protein